MTIRVADPTHCHCLSNVPDQVTVHAGARQRRAGFTLLEMLLVLGLIVTLAGLSYPALRRPLANQRLRSAAKQLRAELARARLRAIQSGESQQFRYISGAARFRVGADELLPPASDMGQDVDGGPRLSSGGDSAKASTDAALTPPRWEEQTLSERIRFVGDDAESITNETAAATDPFESSLTADTDADDLSGERWSKPIVFQPDGCSSNASVTVEDEFGSRIVVSMRGLTGTVSLSDIVEPAEEAPP